jgi:hypothetical protein
MHNLCTIRWMLNNNGHYDGPVNDLSPSYPPLLLIIERVKRRLSYPERLSADAKAGSRHREEPTAEEARSATSRSVTPTTAVGATVWLAYCRQPSRSPHALRINTLMVLGRS